MIRLGIFVLVLLVMGARPAVATTGMPVDLVCPVDGTKLKGTALMSTNNAGGQDRDFLTRAGGAQPVLLVVAACPRCHYAAYVEDFGARVDAEVKKVILGGGLSVPPHAPLSPRQDSLEGLATSTLPAWVRHDLVAQVMRLRGADDLELGRQYLTASWAARLEENPFAGLWEMDDAIYERLRKAVKRPELDNRALEEVAFARGLVQALPTLPEDLREPAAIVAGYLLRTHGENAALLEALPALVAELPETEKQGVTDAVGKAIEIDRGYQRLAITHIQRRLAGSAPFRNDEERDSMIYLVAEVYRRLGDRPSAVSWFDQAAATRVAWLRVYVKEQRALLGP